MVSLARHFVPNPVSSNRTDRRLKCQCPLFLHTRYDALGRRAVMIDPDGGRTTYGYDAKGREVWQKNPLSQRTTFVYDAADRTTELYVANGARTSYVYDAGNRLTALTNLTSTGTIISSFTYTYDRVGNRTGVAEADGARTTWTYDKTYQLTNERRSDVLGWESLTVDQWDAMSVDDWDKMEVSGAGAIFNVTYTYDPVGNRLLREDSGALTTYVYDAANELLTAESSSGVTTYTYDGDGNRLTKDHPADGVNTYAWDTQNRLLSVHDPVAGRFTFAYNADGQRVERKTPSQQRKFVYDFRKPLLETTAENLTTLTYDYSNRDTYGELIGRREHDDETSFHQYDALGSTESLLDALEAVTHRYAYRAFGKIESKTGDTENRQTFVGKFGYFSEEDLGLYFLNARYYDLATGEFVSRDPIGYEGSPYNLYEYVGDSPTNGTDPSGKIVLCGTATVGCQVGKVDVPVYGKSKRAADILALGGGKTGCVTFLTAIHCTMSCAAIKTTVAASTPPPKTVPILEHEACHYCLLKDKPQQGSTYGECRGLLWYLFSAGPAPDYCVGNERPAKPNW